MEGCDGECACHGPLLLEGAEHAPPPPLPERYGWPMLLMKGYSLEGRGGGGGGAEDWCEDKEAVTPMAEAESREVRDGSDWWARSSSIRWPGAGEGQNLDDGGGSACVGLQELRHRWLGREVGSWSAGWEGT